MAAVAVLAAGLAGLAAAGWRCKTQRMRQQVRNRAARRAGYLGVLVAASGRRFVVCCCSVLPAAQW
jgi:hypothetical protein